MAPLEHAQLQPANGLFGPLLNFVRADAPVAPLVEHLLHNTFLVDSLDTALALARQHADLPLRFITPEGDAIDLYGRVAGCKAGDEESTVLGRRREIRLLRDLLARQKAQLVALDLQIEVQHQRRSTLEQALRTLSDEVNAWREEERELTHRQQSTSAEVQRLEARLNQLRADIARLAERSQMLSITIAEQKTPTRRDRVKKQGTRRGNCRRRIQTARKRKCAPGKTRPTRYFAR